MLLNIYLDGEGGINMERTSIIDPNIIKVYRCFVCGFETESEQKAKNHQITEMHFVDIMLVRK